MGILLLVIIILIIVIDANQIINHGKRFQESNKLEQLWRYRFYLKVPFLWVYETIKGLRVYRDEIDENGVFHHTDKYDIIKGKNLWKILISMEQGNMKWYYTSEEVFGNIKKKIKNKK